jgi:GNAT superfamily N-acetyltransferase
LTLGPYRCGVARLEALAIAAFSALYGERARPLGGGAVAFRVDEAPLSPMLNRIVGLGVEDPVTEAAVDAALELLAGTTHYVAISPGARPPELTAWLRARGLEPGWGWMQFRRDVDDMPQPRTDLELVEVGRSTAPAFARVVRVTYGLPAEVEPFLARIVDTPWQAWLALAGDEPAAAGALFTDGTGAYLGFAGTLLEHRGKGAQSALLTMRIRRARRLGCQWLVTETGEQRPDHPSSSYRNILRAGFTEGYVIANWRKDAANAV